MIGGQLKQVSIPDTGLTAYSDTGYNDTPATGTFL